MYIMHMLLLITLCILCICFMLYAYYAYALCFMHIRSKLETRRFSLIVNCSFWNSCDLNVNYIVNVSSIKVQLRLSKLSSYV